jgi:putative hydrolase of the HAD superfamily
MIKNIIFDLGNVLVSFRPAEYLENKEEGRIRDLILTDIFGSHEWLMLDNGDITTEEAIERISLRSSLKRDKIADIFNRRIEILQPIISNIKVLPELKKQGLGLYYLSNFPLDMWKQVQSMNNDRYSFFEYFYGGIISAEARISKPDLRIYRLLLREYSLKPAECLFIDDLEPNVKSAEEVGMKGFYTRGETGIAEEVLSRATSAH